MRWWILTIFGGNVYNKVGKSRQLKDNRIYHLTSASALPCRNGNTKITSLHFLPSFNCLLSMKRTCKNYYKHARDRSENLGDLFSVHVILLYLYSFIYIIFIYFFNFYIRVRCSEQETTTSTELMTTTGKIQLPTLLHHADNWCIGLIITTT